MKRKIGVVTGTRAEYGYLRPLLKKIKENKNLKVSLYVTGMHLLKEYGNTIKEIKKDGFKIKKTIDMKIKKDSTGFDLSVSIAEGVLRFAETFKWNRPDILVVFGDRIEPFAAAIAANGLNIPIAHISGGEVGFGDIDNNLRHAITKLSHLHFPSSKESKERILKLGEEEWRVFRVGALSLDVILNIKKTPKKDLFKKYNLPNKPLILLNYHPVTIESENAEKQIELVMKAVISIANNENMEIIVIYPNAYPGGFQIIKLIRRYEQKNRNVHVFENIPHQDYISLMSASSVFVGNSSSGIIEAPSLGTPYVCIGIRQKGRERAKNVIDVGYEKDKIISGIKKALYDEDFLNTVKKCLSPYGDGKASKRIVDVLKKIKINKKLLAKKITY